NEELERALLTRMTDATVDPDRILVVTERFIALEPRDHVIWLADDEVLAHDVRSVVRHRRHLRCAQRRDEALADRSLVLEPGAEGAVKSTEIALEPCRIGFGLSDESVLKQHDLRPGHGRILVAGSVEALHEGRDLAVARGERRHLNIAAIGDGE